MLPRFRTSVDYKTADQKQTGRRCQLEVVPSAERVWYRKPTQPDGEKAVMSSKWKEGLWSGHCRNSNEVWVGGRDGAVKAWTARRRVTAERWDWRAVSKLKATPEDPQEMCDETQGHTHLPTTRARRSQKLRRRMVTEAPIFAFKGQGLQPLRALR